MVGFINCLIGDFRFSGEQALFFIKRAWQAMRLNMKAQKEAA